MKSRTNLFYISLLAYILLADRFAKIFMDITAKNYGAAFGIFQGYRLLFIILAIAVIFITSYYLITSKSDSLKMGLALILAGSAGNLIDRIFYGYVIDILKIPLFNLPSFNLADLSSMSGAVLLVIYLLKRSKVY